MDKTGVRVAALAILIAAALIVDGGAPAAEAQAERAPSGHTYAAAAAHHRTIRRCPVATSHAETAVELPFIARVRTANTPCEAVLGPEGRLEYPDGEAYATVVARVDRWSLPRHFTVAVAVEWEEVGEEGYEELQPTVVQHWHCAAKAYYHRSGLQPNTDLGDVYGHRIMCIRSDQWVEVWTANEP